MTGRHRLAASVAVAVLGVFAQPSTAGATVNSLSSSGAVSPPPVNATSSEVSLSFGFDTTYSGGFNPVPSSTVFHFDGDITFDTTGIPECAPTSVTNVSTVQAMAACGTAKVGSGTALYNAGTTSAVITAFNGTPSGGSDRLLIHIEIPSGPTYLLLVGEIGPSSRGAPFGTEINVPPTSWPNTAGFAITNFALTLDNLEGSPGHHYVNARCTQPTRSLSFAVDFTYWDASTNAASASQACGASGERAAALKDCKRRARKHEWSRKRRRKCRKRANLLPV
jgi:hypothetical protein